MDQSVKRKKLYMDTIKDIHVALRSTASYQEDHPISRGIIDGKKLLMDDVRVDSKDTFSIKYAMDLKHYLNPLHMYCRLRNFGIGKRPAAFLCRFYERAIFKYLLE